MSNAIEENNKLIQRAQEKINNLNIEDIAENLYNAVMSNYMWRGKKSLQYNYPFFIEHIGTHASFERISPNVHEVYNVSDEKIKKKLIDSVTWIIDNYNKKIRVNWDYEKDKQEYEKIWMIGIEKLLSSFSGGEEGYPLTLHELENGNYLLKENSKEMRNYIKAQFGNSISNKIKTNESVKKSFYVKIQPMEILPFGFWERGIKEGLGTFILLNKIYDKGTFFGENKYDFDINKFISLGLNSNHVNFFFEELIGELKPSFQERYFKDFLKEFNKINNESSKKSFINSLEGALTKSGYFSRVGEKIIFDKEKYIAK